MLCCMTVLFVPSPSNHLPFKVSLSLWYTTKSQEARSFELTHLCVDLLIASQMGLRRQVHCHSDLDLSSFPFYHNNFAIYNYFLKLKVVCSDHLILQKINLNVRYDMKVGSLLFRLSDIMRQVGLEVFWTANHCSSINLMDLYISLSKNVRKCIEVTDRTIERTGSFIIQIILILILFIKCDVLIILHLNIKFTVSVQLLINQYFLCKI